MSLFSALSKWTRSAFALDLASSSASASSSDPAYFSDGVAMAHCLHRIDPAHFTEAWRQKCQKPSDPALLRLKVNNVKKVLHSVMEYYRDALNMQLGVDAFPPPDANLVAEGKSELETGRLLQLILGCAVNCERKEGYIESIMVMEEQVQQVIMQAIQELMHLQVPMESESSLPVMSQGDVRKLMEDLNEKEREKEALKQKCHELEVQVDMLQDEKINMSAEYEQLQAQVGGDGGASAAKMRQEDTGILNQELKKQVEVLSEDLFKMETQRDELQVKNELLEKQAEESQTREAELQKLADQALKLKDEVDILRETSDKVTKYELSIESYKKKLEELGDLKRQVKLLEDKNTDYMQKNMELEESVKKTGSWKPQVDVYKKQIAELHAKLDSETKKSDRLAFETKKLAEKVEALSVERDRLQAERDDLRSRHDELQDEVKFGQATTEAGAGGRGGAGRGADGAGVAGDEVVAFGEVIPPSVKERLLRLQHENKQLKASSSQGCDVQLLQTMVDDLKERETELQAANRKANQKIMELESRLEESARAGGTAGATAPVPRVPGSREDLELRVAEAGKKIHALEETIKKKDLEMHGMEERYKKYIEKAKSVIKTLDPKVNANAAGGGGGGSGGVEATALRSQIVEKDRLIENLEHETEKARAVREMEERLITSAFYNLSMQMQRNAVENRLSNMGSQGQSFLARQRQRGAGQSAAPAAASSAASTSTGGGGGAASSNAPGGKYPSDFLDY